MKGTIFLLLLFVLFAGFGLACVAGDDHDGDGLSDDQEAILGTDLMDDDTDGDGLNDGEEYFDYLTDPRAADSDSDGLTDCEDEFPQFLSYRDINGVATTTACLLGNSGGQKFHQTVVVRVGNVITVDWVNYLQEFSLMRSEMVMAFDYVDPSQEDSVASGSCVVDKESRMATIVLPTYGGVQSWEIPWQAPAMTLSDWPYRLYCEPLAVGLTYHFSVFSHELLTWGEQPFFTAICKVLGTEVLPLDSKLGRKEYKVYVGECTLEHPTFNDPYFRAFLGEDPRLTIRVYVTVEHGVILRYTMPYFRITPAKSVGFSDFFVEH